MNPSDVENNAIAINSEVRDEVTEQVAIDGNEQGYSNDEKAENFVAKESVDEQQSEKGEKLNTKMTSPQMITGPCNLVCNWSVRKDVDYKIVRGQTNGTGKPSNSKTIPATPHAYKVLTTYRKNRIEALNNRQEEERKMREFHARPMPNFQSLQYQMECKKQPIHQCSVPLTPKVLKESRENNEKRKKRVRATIHIKTNRVKLIFNNFI